MTLEEVKVEPGVGLNMIAAPVCVGVGVTAGVGVALGVGVAVTVGVGVKVGLGVGVLLPPGVAVGVGVGVGAPEHVGNLKEPIRVTQFRPLTGKYMFVYQKVQSSTGSTLIAL